METTTSTPQDSNDQTAGHASGPQGPSYPTRPPIFRPVRGRMLAGVAAGAADYLNVDPAIVRIALAVLALAGPGIPIYLAGWLLIPDEGARQSVAADVLDSIS